ncbi:MAG: lipocalin family protein [Bdellovibrionaceae bacterium]|nr:lipocalin family protein [Pseudobdellovibrionaceae bacterium]
MKKFFARRIAVLLSALLCSACVFAQPDDPQVVSAVDLKRYMGKWLEIAHSPNFFQKGCVRSTAEYTLNEDGSVKVYNVCTKGDGSVSDIEGVATVPNANEPAKLKVDFGFPWKGDYWVIDLEPNYEWAVVSGPGKDSLFFLSRTAPMPVATLQPILERLEAQGFETDEFVFDQW